MKLFLQTASAVLLAILTLDSGARAAQFTPLEWQQLITQNADSSLVNQRKHTTWIRDLNRNFIDDVIESRFHSGNLVDVIVDLNYPYRPAQIDSFLSGLGSVGYICRTVSFVFLSDVPYDSLGTLASLPQVSMVEWQVPGQPMLDVATRAIEMRESTTYPNSVEASNPNLVGTGVNVAIVDTGVDDGQHESLPDTKFVKGFNALLYEDTNHNGINDLCEGGVSCDEEGDGATNPDDIDGHGTYVAGIALGVGGEGRDCRTIDPTWTNSCAGVAPGAKLIDVKVCESGLCLPINLSEALDWLAAKRYELELRVVNLSLGFCVCDEGTQDDGTCALAQQVNYLSALGVSVIVAHGNGPACYLLPGQVYTMVPGSASFATTVAATNDGGTVDRSGDSVWSDGYLRGPRKDFDATQELLALKPDIAAPGQDVSSATANTVDYYHEESGTSAAAPLVAGAAAVLLQLAPDLDPGSLKDLLLQTADSNQNETPTLYSSFAPWDDKWGAGFLNLGAGVAELQIADLGFTSCVGPPSSPGEPCELASLPSWNNSLDITTESPPEVGVPNTITVSVTNNGSVDATARVAFGVYVFSVGNNQFYHIGTQERTFLAGQTTLVSQDWTPTDASHQCVQANIVFGMDTDYSNNVTQRNLTISASVYEVRVENPYFVPTDFRVKLKSHRDGWDCTCNETSFSIDPISEGPKLIEVSFHAPPDAGPGERATCDVEVFARQEVTSRERTRARVGRFTSIGGVTVQTFKPIPCRVVGQVLDSNREPVASAELVFWKESYGEGEGEELRVMADEVGMFSAKLTPGIRHRVYVSKRGIGSGELTFRPVCGVGTLILKLSEETVEISRPGTR